MEEFQGEKKKLQKLGEVARRNRMEKVRKCFTNKRETLNNAKGRGPDGIF